MQEESLAVLLLMERLKDAIPSLMEASLDKICLVELQVNAELM